MSRPAEFRTSRSPFVRRTDREGKKLELDFEIIEFSNNHKLNAEMNLESLHDLRLQLVAAEKAGKHSKSKKIRREINRIMENQLYIEYSWCGGCLNYLHQCQCPALDEVLNF